MVESSVSRNPRKSEDIPKPQENIWATNLVVDVGEEVLRQGTDDPQEAEDPEIDVQETDPTDTEMIEETDTDQDPDLDPEIDTEDHPETEVDHQEGDVKRGIL